MTEALFTDREHAGRRLAVELEAERGANAVVVGLARGGVVVAAEVARQLELELDVVAVRKIGHPWQPEYAIGAVAPGGGIYLRGPDGLTEQEIVAPVEAAEREAEELDRRLHAGRAPLELVGRPCILVDDGLATGATMVAAIRWARKRRASRVTAAVPVAAAQSAGQIREEADSFVCPYELDHFLAVALWYSRFEPVDDDEVVRLLEEAGR